MTTTIPRDAMDDLDDAINALVRRGTDTIEGERVLAAVLLAGSPFDRDDLAALRDRLAYRLTIAELVTEPEPWYRRLRGVRPLAHAIAPRPCPYCASTGGIVGRLAPRRHVCAFLRT